MSMADPLVWMDLEMTGLDPEREVIIEMASIITDGQSKIIAEGPELVIRADEALLARMDDWNKRQHRESGLIDRVRASTLSMKDAEDQTIAFLAPYLGPRTAPLTGNSVHQDRRFLARHMPRLEAYLHYRIVDVSTVKELARRWYPQVFAAAPEKGGGHRALADIRDSIAELAYYRERIFVAPPGP